MFIRRNFVSVNVFIRINIYTDSLRGYFLDLKVTATRNILDNRRNICIIVYLLIIPTAAVTDHHHHRHHHHHHQPFMPLVRWPPQFFPPHSTPIMGCSKAVFSSFQNTLFTIFQGNMADRYFPILDIMKKYRRSLDTLCSSFIE